MVGVTGFEPATYTSRIHRSIIRRRSQKCAKVYKTRHFMLDVVRRRSCKIVASHA